MWADRLKSMPAIGIWKHDEKLCFPLEKKKKVYLDIDQGYFHFVSLAIFDPLT